MREVSLSRGMVALVDDTDHGAVVAAGPWHARPGGQTFYARHSVTDSRQVGLHNFLTGWAFVDHINGDGLDNQRFNLRAATFSQNAMNRQIRSDNRAGFKGVSASSTGAGWFARIYVHGRCHRLGSHPTPEHAARAYDRAALQLFGEFARLNFPLTQEST